MSFQFYPYPLKQAWKYLTFHFSRDYETFESPFDAPIVITTTVLCVGPFQWRWTS